MGDEEALERTEEARLRVVVALAGLPADPPVETPKTPIVLHPAEAEAAMRVLLHGRPEGA